MPNDLIIWTAFKAGSTDAFSGIYQAYFHILLSYGCKITSYRNLVEDSIQDVFIELWSGRERLKNTTSIKFYLFKCVRRKIFKNLKGYLLPVLLKDYYRRAGTDNAVTNSAEEYFVNKETAYEHAMQVQEKLSQLTGQQRMALYLKFYRNYNIKQISNSMSLSLKSTYNLVSKGITSMRSLLKDRTAVCTNGYHHLTTRTKTPHGNT